MLKRLFTSKVRVKLLSLFLLEPEKEFFIRQLTRKLDEQINSVRRELDNLKKIGLLTARVKNRKKYYQVNQNFLLFSELRSIVMKAMNNNEDLVKTINKAGKIDLLVLSGVFLNKEAEADLLIVGELDKAELEEILDEKIEQAVRFTVMNKEDFLYRLKCNDKFIANLVDDSENIVAVNKLTKYIN
jgi:DNA-binding transcriptional ArsR family regulator